MARSRQFADHLYSSAMRDNVGSTHVRPLTAAERSQLGRVLAPRDNVTERELKALNALRAAGLLPADQAANVEKLSPFSAAIGALDTYTATEEFGALREQYRNLQRTSVADERRREANELRQILEGLPEAARTVLAKNLGRVIERKEKAAETFSKPREPKKKSKAPEPARSNPGVTALALALPNPAPASAPEPTEDDIRRNSTMRRKATKAQLAALARGRAARAAKLRDNISPQRFGKLKGEGAAFLANDKAVKDLLAELLPKGRTYAKAQRRAVKRDRSPDSIYEVAFKDPKSGEMRMRPSRYRLAQMAAENPNDYAVVLRPRVEPIVSHAKLVDAPPGSPELAKAQAQVARLKERLRVKSGAPGFRPGVLPEAEAQAVLAQMKALNVSASKLAQAQKLLAGHSTKGRKAGPQPKTVANLEARLRELEKNIAQGKVAKSVLRDPPKGGMNIGAFMRGLTPAERKEWARLGRLGPDGKAARQEFMAAHRGGSAVGEVAAATTATGRGRRGKGGARKNGYRANASGFSLSLITASAKAKPVVFAGTAFAGAAGFLVLSGMVRKYMGDKMSVSAIRYGVGGGLGIALLTGFSVFGKLSTPTRLGLGVGVLTATVLQDLVLGLMGKIPGIKDLISDSGTAGVGSLYDTAFSSGYDGVGRYVGTEGLGEYVATSGMGADVYQANAGVGAYLSDENAMSGFGVDVRAAAAGVGVDVRAAAAGVGYDMSDDDVALQAAEAEDLQDGELSMEGLGEIPTTSPDLKIMYAHKTALPALRRRFNLQMIRNSKIKQGASIVAIPRQELQPGTGTNPVPSQIPEVPSSLPLNQHTGRGISPRGIFQESVFGPLDDVLGPVN